MSATVSTMFFLVSTLFTFVNTLFFFITTVLTLVSTVFSFLNICSGGLLKQSMGARNRRGDEIEKNSTHRLSSSNTI